jgi:hypothetical protein
MVASLTGIHRQRARRALGALLGLCCACCGVEHTAGPEFWPPAADDASTPSGDSSVTPPPRAIDASAPDASAIPSNGDASLSDPVPPKADCLTVTVTTATTNGRYAPNNVGVIWITNDKGDFIKTLTLWAADRKFELNAWAVSGNNAGVPGNTVDAITGATALAYSPHTGSWNCADFNEKAVPDGDYRVHFEMTEANAYGPTDSVTFVKSHVPSTVTPPDAPSFKARRLVFSP